MKIVSIILILCVLQYQLITTHGLSRKKRASAAEIKNKIDATNAWQVVGLGGRYGALKSSVSKDKLIESDHFPPKNTYKYAKSDDIKKISPTNMAAVSLRYKDHRPFITTGLSPEAQLRLQRFFIAGDYFNAIDLNIKWYRSNPDRDGNDRDRFDNYIKQGIKDALEIHVKNELINEAQKQQLIRDNDLDIINPTMTNLLNLELRREAREYLVNDIRRYNPK